MNSDPSYHDELRLPLESLLLRLELADLRLDPSGRLRLVQVLNLMGRDRLADPDYLHDTLSPLIARSEAEQVRFASTFRLWWNEEIEAGTESDPIPTQPHSPWWIAPAILIASIFLVGLYVWFTKSPKPPPIQVAVTPTCLVVGDSVEISEAGLKKEDHFVWDFGDGERDSLNPAPTHAYVHAGTYTVRLQVGDLIDSKQLYVHEDKAPIAAISFDPNPPRQGAEYTFQADSQHTGWRYEWDFGDGDTAIGPEVQHRFAEDSANQQTYTVSLRIHLEGDAGGLCTDYHSTVLDLRDNEERVALPELEPLRDPTMGRRYWAALAGWLCLVLALLLPGMAWLGIRYVGRSLYTREVRAALRPGEIPPYRPPFPSQDHLLARDQEFYALAHALRQRQRGNRPFLDVHASLRASVQKAGFPDLRFRFYSQPVEWLLLIDRGSATDHTGQLFQAHVQRLRQEEILLDVYYFDEDPRFCFSEKGDSISLETLARRYPTHRLLVWSRGEALMDQYSAAMRSWVQPAFSRWKARAWVEPACDW